jgi:hypothetical protein
MTASIKITWNKSAMRRVAEEAGRKAMEIAQAAASETRCLDHGEIVRVLDHNPRTGEFKLWACCGPAKRTAIEGIQRAFR